MPTNQPEWRCIGGIGDVNPIDYGGGFVFVDDSGVYPPELEWIEPPDESGWRGGFGPWTIYRCTLYRCTFIGGILSDNKYHPECAAWFADGIIARRFECDGNDLIEDITSDDPMRLAFAYWDVACSEGWENLNHYPLELRLREIRKRLADPRYDVRPEPAFKLTQESTK